jgi:hypothetical protein
LQLKSSLIFKEEWPLLREEIYYQTINNN